MGVGFNWPMRRLSSVFGVVLSVMSFSAHSTNFELPDLAERIRMLDLMRQEVLRLDGEGLLVRENRPESWDRTVDRLQAELIAAGTPRAFAKVFLRFDASYANWHARSRLGKELAGAAPKRISPSVRFMGEWLGPDQTQIVVESVDSNFPGGGADRPQPGDLIRAINGKGIDTWLDENFLFCKYALKSQCDFDFGYQFFRQVLSWNSVERLNYTLERAGRTWTVDVPFSESPSLASRAPAECRAERGYLGFHRVYAGLRACVYESDTDPSTALIRISSFVYRNLAPEEKIRSVSDEVEALLPWWQGHATWKHLLIDVTSNGGGESPIPYYGILLTKPFQEQYVTFHKIREFEDQRMRRALFWSAGDRDGSHELWFKKIVSNGTWAKIPFGDFLPPVPMFCPYQDRPCDEGSFSTFEHPFRGQVSVLVNSYCFSSCDGFVWTVKTLLQDRTKVYGHPQAADSAFSRVDVHLVKDLRTQTYHTEVTPQGVSPSSGPSLLNQGVVVTRSTDAAGEYLSGRPVPLDQFIPLTRSNQDHWIDDVVGAALAGH